MATWLKIIHDLEYFRIHGKSFIFGYYPNQSSKIWSHKINSFAKRWEDETINSLGSSSSKMSLKTSEAAGLFGAVVGLNESNSPTSILGIFGR